MPTAPLDPAESFATLLRCLGQAVVAMMGGERLSLWLIARIIERIRVIHQRFARIAARVEAGGYVPRTVAPHRRTAGPRRPNPLPKKFGWLRGLVPATVGHRAQLEHTLADPDMVALIQAAPTALARPLRSLCWMLGLEPPPILAIPRRTAPLPAPPPAPAPTEPPAPAETQAPAEAPAPTKPRAPPSPPARAASRPALPPEIAAQACGPPHPA